jgi:hypothetical protein
MTTSPSPSPSPSTTITFLIFVTRKPTLSPDAFKDYYENKHIPLLRSLAGPIFPISHTRRYLARDPTPPDYPPRVILGNPDGFDYDAFAEATFENEDMLREFQKVMVSKEVLEDEDRFTDRSRLRVVALGETRVAERPGE